MKHNDLKGMALSAAGFSVFALGDGIIKYLSAWYSVPALLFYALSVASCCLLAASPWLGGIRQSLRTKKLKIHLLRGIFVCIQMFLIVYAFGHMSLAEAYAIVFSAPFITTLLSLVLLREKVSSQQWAAVALGFCGVLVILRPGMVPFSLPALCALAASFFFSMFNILAKFLGKPGENGETTLSIVVFAELVALFCTTIYFVSQGFIVPQPQHIPWFIATGVTSAIGVLCTSMAFVYAKPVLAAPFHYIQMLWGVGLGWLVFGDMLDLWTAAGAAIVIASGLWLIAQEASGLRPAAIAATDHAAG